MLLTEIERIDLEKKRILNTLEIHYHFNDHKMLVLNPLKEVDGGAQNQLISVYNPPNLLCLSRRWSCVS